MLKAFAYATLICLFFSCSHSYSEIHKWVDAEGRVHYSDEKPNNQETEVLEIIEPQTFEHTSVYDIPDFLGFFKSPEKKSKSKNKKVVMYSTERCGYCKKAKKHFARNKIPYTEKDINKSQKNRKEWQNLGGGGVPIILIGKKKIHGFDPAVFDRHYNK